MSWKLVSSAISNLFVNSCIDDFYFFERTIVTVGFDNSHTFYDVHSCVDTTEYRMFTFKNSGKLLLSWKQIYQWIITVKMLTRSQSDEKLRSICVWTTVCHGENSSSWMSQIWMKFIGKLFSIDWVSSSTSPCWISTLNHKISNDSVEECVVVISTSGQFGEIATSIWSMFPVQFDGKFTGTEKYLSIIIPHENIWIICYLELTWFPL